MIKQIFSETDANKCDQLLTKLIQDERQYNTEIDEKMVVKDYFCNVIKDDRNILLGYYDNDIVIGYIFLKYVNQNSYLIDGIYVEEEYRNRGIASELIQDAINVLKSKNCRFIDINVMYQNEKAKYIYKKFGFEEYKVSLRKNL